MSADRTEVIIIGGGQAGLAMSYLLTEQGRPHVVLEQDRIAESWRTRRWDSLRLIAPNWSLRLPGFAYSGDDPDGFMGKDEVATHLEAYARSFEAPVREGVRVLAIECDPSGAGFRLRAEHEVYRATQVVVATGALQKPRVPAFAKHLPDHVVQVVPPAYRNPAALPPGAVLVVGSGQSGCQIAEELRRAGRTVYLSVSRSWWIPRRYRGRDASHWVRAIGLFDRRVDDLPASARTGGPNPQMTGGDGGHDISARTLAVEGVTLLGRLQDIRNGKASFAPDLAANLSWGDNEAFGFLRDVDTLIRQQSLESPAEKWPGDLHPVEDLARAAPEALDLARAEIGAVVWAAGYRPDLRWVQQPILDADGWPRQQRGVTETPGLFILGLDWLHTAKSGLFAGVGEDAEHIAAVMATDRTASSNPVRQL